MKNKRLWLWTLVVLIAVASIFYYNNRTEKKYVQELQIWVETKYKNWKVKESMEYYDNWKIKEKRIFNDKEQLIDVEYYDVNWNNPIEYYENWEIKKIVHYYWNWQIMEEKWYNEEWNIDWKYIAYYSNWQTRIEENYKDWIIQDNKVIEYFENWKVKKEYNYIDWKMEWKRIQYYKNWQIERESDWKNDELDWRSISYYQNWQIERDEYYKNWLLDGRRTEYREDWYISNECEYRDWEEIRCSRGLNKFVNEKWWWWVEVENIYGDRGNLIQRKLYEYDEEWNKRYEWIFEVWNNKSTIIMYDGNWDINGQMVCNATLAWFSISEDSFYDDEELVCSAVHHYLDWWIIKSKYRGDSWKSIYYNEIWKLGIEFILKNLELIQEKFYDKDWNEIKGKF